MEKPIVIISAPRSGSSLTAGIFAEHGVFTGTCRPGNPSNPKGFFENIRICNEISKRFKGYVTAGKPCEPVEGWRGMVEKMLEQEGYTGGPWLIKHSAMYAPLWYEFDPYFICVKRDKDAVLKSGHKTGYFKASEESYERHVEIMDSVNGFDVWPEKGDFEDFQKMLKYCNIEPELDKIIDFYEPNYWKCGDA